MEHEHPVQIGIAVVEYQETFLVGTRNSTDSLNGRAEFPGGKCEPGETPRDAALRECREETGLLTIPVAELMQCVFQYPEGSVELHFWLCEPTQPDFIEEHHQGYTWIPWEELGKLHFPDANTPVVKMLMERKRGEFPQVKED